MVDYIDIAVSRSYAYFMNIELSPDQESRLAELAAREGLSASELAVDLLAPYLHDEADFIRAVEQGIASADRGDLVEHADVVRRIEARLAS